MSFGESRPYNTLRAGDEFAREKKRLCHQSSRLNPNRRPSFDSRRRPERRELRIAALEVVDAGQILKPAALVRIALPCRRTGRPHPNAVDARSRAFALPCPAARPCAHTAWACLREPRDSVAIQADFECQPPRSPGGTRRSWSYSRV